MSLLVFDFLFNATIFFCRCHQVSERRQHEMENNFLTSIELGDEWLPHHTSCEDDATHVEDNACCLLLLHCKRKGPQLTSIEVNKRKDGLQMPPRSYCGCLAFVWGNMQKDCCLWEARMVAEDVTSLGASWQLRLHPLWPYFIIWPLFQDWPSSSDPLLGNTWHTS